MITMVLINVFRGVKTGQTQMNLLSEGFSPVIVIPEEVELVFERVVDVSEKDLEALFTAPASSEPSSPSPEA